MVGINTAIRANAAGIGFAIPIDTAEKATRAPRGDGAMRGATSSTPAELAGEAPLQQI